MRVSEIFLLNQASEGSVSAVLEGRHYNRAVGAHKNMYEALMKMTWRGFISWMIEEHQAELTHVGQGMELIRDLNEDLN